MKKKRDYYPLIMISLGILLYILSGFINKNPYHLILIIISASLFLLILFEAILIYMREVFKKSFKIFGAIIGGAVIVLISIILYFLIGSGTAFYVSVAGFVVSYVLTIINLFSKNGRNERIKNK